NTTAGANGPVATAPGVTITPGGNFATFGVDGNLGKINDITLNSNSFTTTRGATTLRPFSWNKTATADGKSVYTSTQKVYDSLGTAINVNVVASLSSQTSSGSTWTYYVTSPDNVPTTGATTNSVVGMGTLSFDTSGNLVGSTNNSININRAQTGAVPNLTVN